jgi:hypothetical protein
MPERIIEYRNPPPSVCGHEKGVDIRVEPAAAGVVMTLRVECGQVLVDGPEFPQLNTCVRVRAHNARDGRVSEQVSIDDAAGACMPMPEPDLATGLLAGVLVLVAFRLNTKRPPAGDLPTEGRAPQS